MPKLRLPSRIRRARLSANLTQAQLAERIGVGRSAVSQWEVSGGTAPITPHLMAIADATKANFEWLAMGKGTQSHADDSVATNKPKPEGLTQFETQILHLLRRTPDEKKSFVLGLIRLCVTRAW